MMQGGGTGLVARPIFKIASEVPRAAPVGSIPTRSRHPVRAAALLVALALLAAPAAAQDSLPAADTGAAAPAIRGPSPTGALLKSLLVPGLGQITMGRELSAGVFVAFEVGTVLMALDAHNDLQAAEEAMDEVAADDARRRREDWLVLMGVNHVLSGLEAFISAQLWDFPGDLDLRAVPGGVVAGATLPIRVR